MEPLQRKSDHVYISVRLSLKSKLDACNYKESKRLSFFCSFLSDETCMFTGNSVRAFEFCLLVSVCLSNKEGKFLKKLWCCVGGSIKR